MVCVQIVGKTYPLCLTVAALDEVTALCGNLSQVGMYLSGHDSDRESDQQEFQTSDRLAGIAANTVNLLSVLIREGENHRILCARLNGEEADRKSVPDKQDLLHALTVSEAISYRPAVMKAVMESMTREIEAEYPKNVETAEQE